jgi:4,5-dihydroxyphthalate decarboxylase
VFNTFAEAKRLYVERLKAGAIENPTAVDTLHQRVMEITGDPLPYGIAPNRKVLEELVGHARTQGIVTKPVGVDDLFAPATRGLIG